MIQYNLFRNLVGKPKATGLADDNRIAFQQTAIKLAGKPLGMQDIYLDIVTNRAGARGELLSAWLHIGN